MAKNFKFAYVMIIILFFLSLVLVPDQYCKSCLSPFQIFFFTFYKILYHDVKKNTLSHFNNIVFSIFTLQFLIHVSVIVIVHLGLHAGILKN
jgi:hypothetical protein